ncbi:MAG: hypothetical protein E6I29_09700 [Chloroflexi bacterium]|nr:MAG: hypothetical protein E6I29_09700 [Chloroflexota bacterium]
MRTRHEHLSRRHGRDRGGDTVRLLQDRGRRRRRRHRTGHRGRCAPRHPRELPLRIRLGRPQPEKRPRARGGWRRWPPHRAAAGSGHQGDRHGHRSRASRTHARQGNRGCAVGGIINSRSIPTLRCRVIAGGANNQLETPADADALRDRGIAYAPDFVINAGGVLHGGGLEEQHWTHEVLESKLAGIGDVIFEIFLRAEREGISTDAAARRIALARMGKATPVSSP